MYEQLFQIILMNPFGVQCLFYSKNKLNHKRFHHLFWTSSAVSRHLARFGDCVCGSLHVSSKNVWERKPLRKPSLMVLKCLLASEDEFYFNESGFIQCSWLRVSVRVPGLVGRFMAGNGEGGCADSRHRRARMFYGWCWHVSIYGY